MKNPSSLEELIIALRCLPGVGPKSAQRMAFHLLQRDRPGATRELAANCALLEHRGNTLRFAVDPKFARTPQSVERLQQALVKFLGTAVKLEFSDAPPAVETPSQNGQRRSAEALDAAKRSLEEDPAVREMKSRFGATLHPESVRPTEQ